MKTNTHTTRCLLLTATLTLILLTAPAKAQFQSQTTFDPDAKSRGEAGTAFGRVTEGGGGIRTTENHGPAPRRTASTPVRRPVSRPATPLTSQPATPISTAPAARPAPRPAPRQPIKIGSWHSTGQFAPDVVDAYRRAKYDEAHLRQLIQRIRADYRTAQQRRDVQAMQQLRDHYNRAVHGYRLAQDYVSRAEPFLRQRFEIRFSDTVLNQRNAFYAQLRQQIAHNPNLNGKPISVLRRNGKVQVILYPGGRINYGGVDISHLFSL